MILVRSEWTKVCLACDFNRQIPTIIFDLVGDSLNSIARAENRPNQGEGDSCHTLIVSSKLPLIRVLS